MPVNSRRKGADFERKVAHYWQEWGYPARRGQQYSGANGDADVIGVPHIHQECKANEHLNIYDAMEQSARDARDGEIPVVIHKKNGKPILATVYLDDFGTIIREYISGKVLDDGQVTGQAQ